MQPGTEKNKQRSHLLPFPPQNVRHDDVQELNVRAHGFFEVRFERFHVEGDRSLDGFDSAH